MKEKTTLVIAVMASLILASSVFASTHFVAPREDQTANGNLHIKESSVEYPSIQAAINAAVDGDTIVLAPGTFTGEGNRDLDFNGLAITVRSTDPNDPNIVAATIIDCQGTEADPHQGFYFHNNEDVNSVLAGLTIINGYRRTSYGEAAGIQCSYSNPTILNCSLVNNNGIGVSTYRSNNAIIKNCVIANNKWGFTGAYSSTVISNCVISGNAPYGAIYYHSESNLTVRNCIIAGNSSIFSNGCGGIHCGYITSFTIDRCTIINNVSTEAFSGYYEAGGILYDHSGTVINCIIWGNSDPQISKYTQHAPEIVDVIYCDIEGGYYGEGNIDADPFFADPGHWDTNATPDDPTDDFFVVGDYHLRSDRGRYWPEHDVWVLDEVSSPCIDAGDLAVNPIDEPNPNGGRVNIGAYGQTPYASMSDRAITGDINHDGGVDFLDFTIMANNWLDFSLWPKLGY